MERFFQRLIGFDQNLFALLLLIVFYALEQLVNKPFIFQNRPRHLLVSVLLQLGYLGVNYVIAFMVVFCFQWIEQRHIGLLNQIIVPYPLKIITGLFCFDFIFYWAHRLYHVSPLFWRLHRVHHSDTSMDSATSFRFHPFDAVLDSAMYIVAAAIFGLNFESILFFFLLYLPLSFAQHSNLVFPPWTDKLLGKIFVAPNLHKVHHHQVQEFTDSNFGFLFIFWDKLFGTYRHLPVKLLLHPYRIVAPTSFLNLQGPHATRLMHLFSFWPFRARPCEMPTRKINSLSDCSCIIL